MPKEKNYNPVQETKKAEKQKQIKKQKANLQVQRNEKLARRNPFRIQRDIDGLKELEQNGNLRPHERQRLQELEKNLAAVNKARTALGDKAPQFKPERRFNDQQKQDNRVIREDRNCILGKRLRDGRRKIEDSSDTDADVRDIPMPRDTPPPIPKQRYPGPGRTEQAVPVEPKKATIVYEAAPEKRDFLKETTKFMPASVAQKLKLAKGEGRLLEPEEFDKLQEEGYINPDIAKARADIIEAVEKNEELDKFLMAHSTSTTEDMQHAVEAAAQEAEYDMMNAEAEGQMGGIRNEAAVTERKLRQVEIEDVEDEEL